MLAPLLLLMMIGALAEVATIGAILPLLSALSDPLDSPALRMILPVLNFLGADDQTEKILVLVVIFGVATVLSAASRLTLLWMTAKFVNGIAHDISTQIYEDTLCYSYSYHILTKSSDILSTINKVEILSWQVLTPLMNAVVAVVLAVFIVFSLIVIDPLIAVSAGFGLSVVYFLVSRITRGGLSRGSAVIASAQGARIQAMQEGLGGIRDVLLDRSQKVFADAYATAESRFRDARTSNAVLTGSPRFVVEALGMILVAGLAVIVAGRAGNLLAAVPVLGALALGAQRLMPLMQQVYSGWASVMGNRQVLLDVASLLGRPRPSIELSGPALSFGSGLQLINVYYEYPGSRTAAIHDISISVPKGARMGVAGKTGSGKSTLMDLILGLLAPTSGQILVDGVMITDENRAAWQANLAHVPQSIYLSDASIAENVAFGVPRGAIDYARVQEAITKADLADVVAGLPDGVDTHVGERGVQLSGGQRQRVGIARALYKKARLLVFDEATSALDTETEAVVMDAIGNLDRDLTIILVAHRLSTLEKCDRIFLLEGGRLIDRPAPVPRQSEVGA